jgi:hypothetical protein
LQNWKRLYGEEECKTYKNKFGTIVAKGEHEEYNKILYGVKCDNKTPIIIGELGLEFVSKIPNTLPKSSKKKISACQKCSHQTEFLVVNSSSPCFKCEINYAMTMNDELTFYHLPMRDKNELLKNACSCGKSNCKPIQVEISIKRIK